MNIDPEGDFFFVPALIAAAPYIAAGAYALGVGICTAITIRDTTDTIISIKKAKGKTGVLRGRDAKRREKRQVDNALGKNRAAREKQSRDLHKGKKGKRNDDNFDWKDLKNGNYY